MLNVWDGCLPHAPAPFALDHFAHKRVADSPVNSTSLLYKGTASANEIILLFIDFAQGHEARARIVFALGAIVNQSRVFYSGVSHAAPAGKELWKGKSLPSSNALFWRFVDHSADIEELQPYGAALSLCQFGYFKSGASDGFDQALGQRGQ